MEHIKSYGCVFGALKESKLRIKKTKQYTASMEKLTKLYKLSQTQIWIICIACDKYIAFHDSCTMKYICNTLEVSAMTIMTWRKDIELLIEKGFLEWQRIHDKFQPVSDFCDSLYNNKGLRFSRRSDRQHCPQNCDERSDYGRTTRNFRNTRNVQERKK